MMHGECGWVGPGGGGSAARPRAPCRGCPCDGRRRRPVGSRRTRRLAHDCRQFVASSAGTFSEKKTKALPAGPSSDGAYWARTVTPSLSSRSGRSHPSVQAGMPPAFVGISPPRARCPTRFRGFPSGLGTRFAFVTRRDHLVAQHARWQPVRRDRGASCTRR
jgi:hypothetical protein